MSAFLFIYLFTGVHLGRSLDLDPLQLSEARRLCWNQIRSDERWLPPNAVSIPLLWNFTSFVILIHLRSLNYSQRTRAMEGSSGERTQYSQREETQRIWKKREREALYIDPPQGKNHIPEFQNSLWNNPQEQFSTKICSYLSYLQYVYIKQRLNLDDSENNWTQVKRPISRNNWRTNEVRATNVLPLCCQGQTEWLRGCSVSAGGILQSPLIISHSASRGSKDRSVSRFITVITSSADISGALMATQTGFRTIFAAFGDVLNTFSTAGCRNLPL